MKNLNQSIEQIDKFFFDLFTHKEASKTEIHNFLLNYVDFILLYNNIPDEYTTTIHLIKKFRDSVDEFSIKPKKTKHKLRNKENIKKAEYKQYSQTLALCCCDLNLKTFHIYLNNKLFFIEDIENMFNFSCLVSSLGHEVEHLIQEHISPNIVRLCENCYDKKIDKFNENLKELGAKNNYIKKLARKMHTHADNFSILNTCEVNADNNSVVYFQELYKLILNSTNRDAVYYYFLYNIYLDLVKIQDSREKCYALCKKQE